MTGERDKVRWGIVSTANIGRVAVVPALQSASNCEVVGVASRDSERASAYAAEHDIPHAYHGYDALLADHRIDAVYIPLPNNMHGEWTKRAAEAGKHVLCEKPLGMSASECEMMEATCRSNNVVAMEAFMYRFHPRWERVRSLLSDGVIGEVRSLYSAFTFKLQSETNIRWLPEFGGGSLMDVGCYCVNVSRTVIGTEPEAVQAIASWTDRDIDAQMAGLLCFPDGVTAQFDSALSMERRETLHIAGTLGHLELTDAFVPGQGDVTVLERHGRGSQHTHTIRGVDEYRLMVEHFADCIMSGADIRYPLSEAAANMRVLEALYRSARNGGSPEVVAND